MRRRFESIPEDQIVGDNSTERKIKECLTRAVRVRTSLQIRTQQTKHQLAVSHKQIPGTDIPHAQLTQPAAFKREHR
jgi:hypothetical protein